VIFPLSLDLRDGGNAHSSERRFAPEAQSRGCVEGRFEAVDKTEDGSEPDLLPAEPRGPPAAEFSDRDRVVGGGVIRCDLIPFDTPSASSDAPSATSGPWEVQNKSGI
jgi:hypothetical protein